MVFINVLVSSVCLCRTLLPVTSAGKVVRSVVSISPRLLPVKLLNQTTFDLDTFASALVMTIGRRGLKASVRSRVVVRVYSYSFVSTKVDETQLYNRGKIK